MTYSIELKKARYETMRDEAEKCINFIKSRGGKVEHVIISYDVYWLRGYKGLIFYEAAQKIPYTGEYVCTKHQK